MLTFSAATVEVAEGEFKTVQATDDMLYQNIDSCLTVTYAYDTGIRSGGHAVLVPEGQQLSLEQMVERLNNMSQATIFYIAGCIEIWDDNYFSPAGLNKSFTINGMLVDSVESMVPALGYNARSNAVLIDTTNDGSVDILFAVNPSRILTITIRATGQVVFRNPWPVYVQQVSSELQLYQSTFMLVLCVLFSNFL